jgi:glycosyltransferase involved in cell wall biosynthesis
VPAILEDGVHGLLAPDDDAETVAAHMLTLLDDQVTATRLATAARESCCNYDWAVLREQWLDLYQSLAKRRGPARYAEAA